MKTKPILLTILALTLILLSGCDLPEDPTSRYSTHTPEPSLTPVASATLSPGPTATPTPIPPTATPISPDYSRFFFQPIYRPDLGQQFITEGAQALGLPVWIVDPNLYLERIVADDTTTYVAYCPVPVGLQYPSPWFIRCQNSVEGPNSVSGMRPGEVRQYIIQRDGTRGTVVGGALPQSEVQ